MPDPIFTLHSALRLLERGITRDQVLAAVEFGEIVESDNHTDLYALGRLRVVLVRKGSRVVTAWREEKENAKRCVQKARQYARKQRRMCRW